MPGPGPSGRFQTSRSPAPSQGWVPPSRPSSELERCTLQRLARCRWALSDQPPVVEQPGGQHADGHAKQKFPHGLLPVGEGTRRCGWLYRSQPAVDAVLLKDGACVSAIVFSVTRATSTPRACLPAGHCFVVAGQRPVGDHQHHEANRFPSSVTADVLSRAGVLPLIRRTCQ